MLRQFGRLPIVHTVSLQFRGLHNSSFRFGAAVSDNLNLYRAIYEVVESVEQQLDGRPVDFCQLFVTTRHKRNLAHAPECLLDHLCKLGTAASDDKPPVIIGGALQSVCGAGRLIESRPGVSLLAASLPGVELMPFHVRDTSLPHLTTQQWSTLLGRPALQHNSNSRTSPSLGVEEGSDGSSSSSIGSGGHNSAAILVSSPHFVDVEHFLQRLSNVLPSMPVVGGVAERDAWIDTEHELGALLCGSNIHSTGAVGCIMYGPLKLQHLLLPGCRPAGDIMTVTEAVDNVIYALDGKPVHESFVFLLKSLPEQDQKKKELHLGVNADVGARASSAGPRGFVARHMSLTSTSYGRPVLMVATHEVPVGAKVQLLVRDMEHNQQQQQAALSSLVHQLPQSAGSPVSQMAVLSYCCVALPNSEAEVAASILPQVPFAGGRMQGEFAGPCHASHPQSKHHATASAGAGDSSIPPGIGAKLHSYAASFAVLSHLDTSE